MVGLHIYVSLLEGFSPHVSFHPHSPGPATVGCATCGKPFFPRSFRMPRLKCALLSPPWRNARGAAKPTRDLHGWPRQKWGDLTKSWTKIVIFRGKVDAKNTGKKKSIGFFNFPKTSDKPSWVSISIQPVTLQSSQSNGYRSTARGGPQNNLQG
jgi:hypothetical protein